jgi:diadenosine tetraphosphate (Ap4A) HIT family hydrolase
MRADPTQAREHDCAICEFTTTQAPIHEDEHWFAGVLAGLEVPGWVVLALKRHATSAAELSHEEASTMGPLVAEISAAVEAATDAQRVYLLAYGEHAPHFHVLLAARGVEVPVEHRHAAFWDHRASYVDQAAAQKISERVRQSLLDSGNALSR